MDPSKAWFVQRRRWQRPLIASWKGALAGLVFVVAFFAIAALVLSLQPFDPLNLWLLGLWWLAVIGLMIGFHLIARTRTDRLWEREPTGSKGHSRG